MKLEAKHWSSGFYVIHSKLKPAFDNSYFLWKDGTTQFASTGYAEIGSPADFSKAQGYWKTEQEAQQFLDNWMPRKKPFTINEIKYVSQSSERIALYYSIEHWKQNVLDVEHAHLGSSYCAICLKAHREKKERWGSCSCEHCVLNDYKDLYPINCCKEYENFVGNKTEENAIAMLNKLVLIRNKKYGNPYEKVEEKKMSNKIVFDDGKEVELSKETTERLRKELVKPKPYQFKAGDVVKNHYGYRRIIIEYDGKLLSLGIDPAGIRSEGQKCFEDAGYKKIGELKDFIESK